MQAKCWTVKLANLIAIACNTAAIMPYFWYKSWHNSIFAVRGFVASFCYMLCFSLSAAIMNQSNEPSPDWDCGFPGHGPLADRFDTNACSGLKEGNAYSLFVAAWLFCGTGAATLYFNTAARCLGPENCCDALCVENSVASPAARASPAAVACKGNHRVAGANGCHDDRCRGLELCVAECAGCPDIPSSASIRADQEVVVDMNNAPSATPHTAQPADPSFSSQFNPAPAYVPVPAAPPSYAAYNKAFADGTFQ